MLIRSQSKSAIININNVSFIEILDMGVRVMVSVEAMNDSCNIAEYSTKEKALKVLDMVQEAYAEYEMLLQAFMGIDSARVTTTEKEILDKKKRILRKKAIFQMPEDSEVEM